MKKKFFLILDDDFVSYCEINNITDIEKKAKETFEKGFLFLKYGYSPMDKIINIVPQPPSPQIKPLNIDKEPIIEKIIEKKSTIYDE